MSSVLLYEALIHLQQALMWVLMFEDPTPRKAVKEHGNYVLQNGGTTYRNNPFCGFPKKFL